MKNMKKTTYIWAITIVIAGLMLTSAVSLAVPVSDDMTTPGISVVKSDKVAQKISMEKTIVDLEPKHVAAILGDPAFEFEEDQVHPALGRDAAGNHMTAYRDDGQEQIIWTFGDDTYTYDPGVYYEIGGDYPSIKLWSGSRFFGTHVTDYEDLGGGATYLFEATDPTNYDTYALTYWDWSGHGWFDMIDADIGTDSSQNEHEWGVNTYVISSTYGDAYTDGPTVVYSDAEDPGSGWISWYYTDNCAHTDGTIDHQTITSYSIYDNDELLTGEWKLLVRVMDFEDVENGADSMYDVTGGGNLQYPAIAVDDDNLVILAETDENGNKDIVCLYSDAGINNLQESFVSMEVDDETYPDVRHVEDLTFVCTYVSGEKLYTKVTEDGGATWSDAEEVDDVVEEYKTADITETASHVMYGYDNGADIDIYIAELGGGIDVPILEVTSITGGIGVTATIKNTGTAAATDVQLGITVTGGILGLINKNASDTVASLAIDEEVTIKSGLIFGLGPIDIEVTATCAEGASATKTDTGKVLIIFTTVG